MVSVTIVPVVSVTMLYKVTLQGTTVDKFQRFFFSILSRQEPWDRTTSTLFPSYEGSLIISDEELDVVRTVCATKSTRQSMSLPFRSGCQKLNEANRQIVATLKDRDTFTFRTLFTYLASAGIIKVESFKYPETKYENTRVKAN